MSMMTVPIEIMGVEFLAEVDYSYYPGSPGKVDGPPEDCYPPEPEELDINYVILVVAENQRVDATKLLENEEFTATLDEAIMEEIWSSQDG